LFVLKAIHVVSEAPRNREPPTSQYGIPVEQTSCQYLLNKSSSSVIIDDQIPSQPVVSVLLDGIVRTTEGNKDPTLVLKSVWERETCDMKGKGSWAVQTSERNAEKRRAVLRSGSRALK
jgi:hypothetical protein